MIQVRWHVLEVTSRRKVEDSFRRRFSFLRRKSVFEYKRKGKSRDDEKVKFEKNKFLAFWPLENELRQLNESLLSPSTLHWKKEKSLRFMDSNRASTLTATRNAKMFNPLWQRLIGRNLKLICYLFTNPYSFLAFCLHLDECVWKF